MSVGVSSGGIAPDTFVETEEAILGDAERCIRELHDNSRPVDVPSRITAFSGSPSDQKWWSLSAGGGERRAQDYVPFCGHLCPAQILNLPVRLSTTAKPAGSQCCEWLWVQAAKR
jgi:hypothetical protein